MTTTERELRNLAEATYNASCEPHWKTWAELCADPACADMVVRMLNVAREWYRTHATTEKERAQ